MLGLVPTENEMKFRVGYELQYDFPQPTPVILMLNIHFTRVSDLAMPDHMIVSPAIPLSGYRDEYGNWCSRFLAPAGHMTISADPVVRDTGRTDPAVSNARQIPVEELPEEALVFLLGSRFCECDQMLDLAWSLFGETEPGWARVKAICDFVISTSRLVMSSRARPRPPWEPIRRAVGYVVTTRTWQWRSAGP